jgi:hypothetical protein
VYSLLKNAHRKSNIYALTCIITDDTETMIRDSLMPAHNPNRKQASQRETVGITRFMARQFYPKTNVEVFPNRFVIIVPVAS